jgi:PleD family two-component response regulator
MALIAIVDDSPTSALPLSRLLEYNGHKVECILRSGGALQKLREPRPDLLLLDVGMPEIDGIELLTLLKGDDELRDVPVVMYSAMSDRRLMEKASALGAADYLVKGGGWEPLIARIESHLAHGSSAGRLT